MWPFDSRKKLASQGKVQQRKHKRMLAPPGVVSDLGDLLDISESGMRVHCAQHLMVAQGDLVWLQLRCGELGMQVRAKVAWIRRTGVKERIMGLQFVGLKPSMLAAIQVLARQGASSRSTQAAPKDQTPVRIAAQLPDPHTVLGVPRDASFELIHKAYRSLARQYHPDFNNSPQALIRFREITDAYRVLKRQAVTAAATV